MTYRLDERRRIFAIKAENMSDKLVANFAHDFFQRQTFHSIADIYGQLTLDIYNNLPYFSLSLLCNMKYYNI